MSPLFVASLRLLSYPRQWVREFAHHFPVTPYFLSSFPPPPPSLFTFSSINFQLSFPYRIRLLGSIGAPFLGFLPCFTPLSSFPSVFVRYLVWLICPVYAPLVVLLFPCPMHVLPLCMCFLNSLFARNPLFPCLRSATIRSPGSITWVQTRSLFVWHIHYPNFK